MHDACPRNWAGFCRIALLGHRLCPDRRDGCSLVDHDAAWEDVRNGAITVLTKKNRRLKREAARG